MKAKIAILVVVLVQTAILISVCGAQDFKLDVKALGGLSLPAPESIAGKKYLGLSDKPEFSLGQLKFDVIFLQIFSMYCPVCQKDASSVNQLFELVEADPKLKGRVRFLGIGTGNTPYEVEVFQKKFNIKFPLIPDDDFRIQKIASSDLRTPTFVIAKIKPGNQVEILKIKVGEIGDSQAFFNSMSKMLGSN